MWIKDNKIKKKITFKQIGFYLFPSVTMFLFTSFEMLRSSQSTSNKRGGFFGEPYTWDEYINHIYIPIAVPVIILILFSISSYLNYRKGVVLGICDKCNKEMDRVKEHSRCSCGGEFINIKNMKWIDNPPKKKKK